MRFNPLLAASAVLAALLAGCAEHRPTDQLAQAVRTGERPVSMKGEDLFFAKTLDVTVTVSRGIGRGMGGGGGMAAGGHGGRHHGGGDSEDFGAPPDVSSMDDDAQAAYLRAKAELGSPMPPVTIHLRLQNLGQAVDTVDVMDFESDLGNFAVHPEVLAVAPGQIAEPDPMISQLGVGSDAIPVKVSLKVGNRTETRTIVVRALPEQPGS